MCSAPVFVHTPPEAPSDSRIHVYSGVSRRSTGQLAAGTSEVSLVRALELEEAEGGSEDKK